MADVPTPMRALFIQGARVICDALADDAVGRAWDSPSVLEEQKVGGLAGHLARGGVWVVDEYLTAPLPDTPFVGTVEDYFIEADQSLTADGHRQIRDRGAEIGSVGQTELVASLSARLDALVDRLAVEPADRVVGVVFGARTMLLDEYLKTRLVEQVVHLDDLARSLDRAPWPMPDEAMRLVIHIGADVGRLRAGATDMIRCLYRTHLAPVLPVM